MSDESQNKASQGTHSTSSYPTDINGFEVGVVPLDTNSFKSSKGQTHDAPRD